MDDDHIKHLIENTVLNAIEASLEAQLKAVRKLRSSPSEPRHASPKSMSQIGLVHDVLRAAGKPLHVSEIIDRIEKTHGVSLDRESIVSSLVKKIKRGDRFVRTDKNVFALKGDE